jgi:hypothetical protein
MMVSMNWKRLFVMSLFALTAVTSASAATKTWTGAVNDLWSEPGNWDLGIPVNGDDVRLNFSNLRTTSTNDLSGLTLQSVSIGAASPPFVFVQGNAITLTGGLNAIGSTMGWNLPTTLAAPQVFYNIGALYLRSTIDLNGQALTLTNVDSAAFFLEGSLVGSGSVQLNHPSFGGALIFSGGTSTFTGTFTVDGALQLRNGSITNSILVVTPAGSVGGNGTVPATSINGGFLGVGSTTIYPAILNTGNLSVFANGGWQRVSPIRPEEPSAVRSERPAR